MTSRRDALKTLAALAAAGIAPRSAFGASFADRIDRVGIQLYTVRSLMSKDMPGTLAAIAGLGYREVEFAGYFGRTPAEVKAMLAQHGLTAPSTHLGMDAVQGGFAATAAEAHGIGINYLTVASLDMRTIRTVDDWKRTADAFNEAGKRAKAEGLRFAYHNHSAEFTPVNGAIPMEILLGGTDSSLVGFELDLYWCVKAGHEPRTWFARFPGRFEMVHVKDATAAPALAMADVGLGTINWKSIFAAHNQAGIQHYFVEHDSPANPLDSARNSVNYLRALTF